MEAVDEGEERAVLHHVVAGLVPGHRVPLPRLPRVPGKYLFRVFYSPDTVNLREVPLTSLSVT